MPSLRFRLSLGILFFAGVSFTFSGQAPLGKLLSKRYPLLKDDDPSIVLISLKDKGDVSLYKASEARSFLSDRAIRRRSRARGSAHVIDERDYPLEQSYVRRIAGIVTQVRHELKWFNAVSAIATRRQVDELRTLPFVTEIEVVGSRGNGLIDASGPFPKQTATSLPSPAAATGLDYGLSLGQAQQIRVPDVHNRGIYGQGVVIGVFDNGVRLLSHQAFSSMHIIAQHDFVDHKESVIPNNTSTTFGSHGVYTLSIIGGYQPGQLIGPAFKSDYILARTENDSSETPIEEDNWAKAIEWADSIGVDVTSTSLGYNVYDPPYPSWTWEDMDGNTTLITRAADYAVGLGIVVVNAAGNDGNATHNTLGAPADGDSVITAGAVDPSGNRIWYSSVGPTTSTPPRIKPDVMARGDGVRYASASNPAGYSSTLGGTSFACPLSAGVAALIRCANPGLSPMQVRDAMRETASNAASPDNLIGWGILNADSAIRYWGILPQGSINGTVFNDINRNGIRDPGEPGLAGVAVHVAGDAGKIVLTDSQGQFRADSLPIGIVTMTADAPRGFSGTAPSGGSYEVSLPFRADTSGFDFGMSTFSSMSFIVDGGWNLLSLPLDPPDHSRAVLYPEAVSNAFIFNSSYVSVQSVPSGVGYWLKFSGSGPCSISGEWRTLDSVALHTGWNMIGTISDPVALGSILQSPGDIVGSAFFAYDNGYVPTMDSLRPDHGYFVKARSDGHIILHSGSAASVSPVSGPVPLALRPVAIDTTWNTITLTDQKGKHQTLHFGHDSTLAANFSDYELPPYPPSDVFDIRFARPDNGSLAWVPRSGDSADVMGIHIQGVTFPLQIMWHMRQDTIRYALYEGSDFGVQRINYTGCDGSIVGPAQFGNADITFLSLHQRTLGDVADCLPTGFALDQNFPNPFPAPANPGTVIRYHLPSVLRGADPAPARFPVTLRIYDVLGREVATLIDGDMQESGDRSVTWDAAGFASGMYIYRLTAGAFTDVRKLMIVR